MYSIKAQVEILGLVALLAITVLLAVSLSLIDQAADTYTLSPPVNQPIENIEICTPSQETCDGMDNDCDSQIDEDACPSEQTCEKFGENWECKPA